MCLKIEHLLKEHAIVLVDVLLSEELGVMELVTDILQDLTERDEPFLNALDRGQRAPWQREPVTDDTRKCPVCRCSLRSQSTLQDPILEGLRSSRCDVKRNDHVRQDLHLVFFEQPLEDLIVTALESAGGTALLLDVKCDRIPRRHGRPLRLHDKIPADDWRRSSGEEGVFGVLMTRPGCHTHGWTTQHHFWRRVAGA